MGRNKRVGRDRDNGPDPLARLAPAVPAAQPWGVTGMPSWLDTPAGREAWAEASEPGGAARSEDAAETGGVGGNDDPDWRPTRSPVDDEPLDDDRLDRDRSDGDRSGDDWSGDDWSGDDWAGGDWSRDDWSGDTGARGELPGLESLGDDDDWEDDWEPPRRRLTMLPPAAIGLIVIGLIACAIAGYSLLEQNQPTTPVVTFDAAAESSEPAGPAASSSAPATASTGAAPDGRIVVSVVGLVNKPGLVTIVDTARVADAIERAGGARPGADLISLNMAQLLRDGDQILVGQGEGGTVKSAVVAATGAPGSDPPGGRPGNGGSLPADGTGLVNLNTATVDQLDTLPGVGPVTAAAIVAWREANGGFTSVDQLAEVDGIGPARLAKLTPLVTVG